MLNYSNKKKVWQIALILAITLLFASIITLTASAASTKVSLVGTSTTGNANATVSVTVSVKENFGFSYMKLGISYEETALNLTNVKNGTVCDSLTEGIYLIWSSDENVTKTGELVTLEFQVLANAPHGDYEIKIDCIECSNDQEKNASTYITNAKITVPHNYDTSTPISDAASHWYACACGAISEKSTHTPGAPATADKPQICTVCKYELAPALGPGSTETHTHEYGTEWRQNAFSHWHECTGCTSQQDSAAHVYESSCSPVCTVCGYTRTVVHSYGDEWKTDDTDHWKQCACGESSEKEAHAWDNGVVTEEATVEEFGVKTFTCTVCGQQKTESIDKLPAPPAETDKPNEQDPDDSQKDPDTNPDTTPDLDMPNIKTTIIIVAAVAIVLVIVIVITIIIVTKKKSDRYRY